MKTDNISSGSTSAATSAGARPTHPNAASTSNPPTEAEVKSVGKAGVGESAYLERQQQLASQAIGETFSALGKELSRTFRPGALMERHPWVTLGATAVAGFAATAVLVPSKEQQALKKLSALERALNPSKSRSRDDEDGHETDGKETGKEKSGHKSRLISIGLTVARELITTLKPLIISLLTAGAGIAAADPDHASSAESAHPGGHSGL